MIGFLPGFAYLGAVDDRIAAPRRATPRLKVPAGSVGIAGRQTGVYPTREPWRVADRGAHADRHVRSAPPATREDAGR